MRISTRDRGGYTRWWTIAVCCFFVAAAEGRLIVPRDSSLSVREYLELGVPDLKRMWSGVDHLEAIRTLNKLDRRALPRFDSSRSGELFARLLETQHLMIEGLWRETPLHAYTLEKVRSTPTMQSTYEWKLEDKLLFDRELLEIHAESLRHAIQELEQLLLDDQELEALTARLHATEELERVNRIREGNEVARKGLQQVAVQSLDYIIEIGAIDAMHSRTRRALSGHLRELVPQAAHHLSGNQVQSTISAIRQLATLKPNATIRGDLVALADSLGPSAP